MSIAAQYIPPLKPQRGEMCTLLNRGFGNPSEARKITSISNASDEQNRLNFTILLC